MKLDRAALVTALVLLLCSRPIDGRAQEKPVSPKKGKTGTARITFSGMKDGRFQLYSIQLNGEGRKLLVPDPRGAMEPRWSSDGKTLAFVSFREGPEQVFSFNPQTGKVRNESPAGTFDRSPAWSADGSRVAFTSARTGNQEIYVRVIGEKAAKNLTNNSGYDADPVWSPDGKRVAFASARDGARFRLFVMNADGSAPRPLYKEPLFGWIFPDWSPDGKQIVVGKWHRPQQIVQLHLLNLADSKLTPITKPEKVNSYARWSPDGRHIAYARLSQLPPGYVAGRDVTHLTQAGADLMIYDVETKKHRVLVAGDLPMWGPTPSWEPTPRVE